MQLKQAQILAENLLQKYQLNDWSFGFDRAKRRFGCCNYMKKHISLSSYLTELNNKMQVEDTILHEIAHALVGPKHNHNQIWKQKALEIGCSAARCYAQGDVILPKGKYTARCVSCKKEFQAQRKKHVACRACCKTYNKGKFSKDFLIEFVEN